MTVGKSADNVVLLEGACPSDDAESLLQFLSATPQPTVDLRSCETAHTAVLQVLLAARPSVLGPPPSGAPLWRWVYPALISHKQ